MNENIKRLLLNKNAYYLNYFIDDIKSIINRIVDVNLIDVGTSMRMVVTFNCNNKYDYFFLKNRLSLERNFLNGTVFSGKYCANFIADKKDNSILKMVQCFNNVEDLPKKDVFNFVKLL